MAKSATITIVAMGEPEESVAVVGLLAASAGIEVTSSTGAMVDDEGEGTTDCVSADDDTVGVGEAADSVARTVRVREGLGLFSWAESDSDDAGAVAVALGDGVLVSVDLCPVGCGSGEALREGAGVGSVDTIFPHSWAG